MMYALGLFRICVVVICTKSDVESSNFIFELLFRALATILGTTEKSRDNNREESSLNARH